MPYEVHKWYITSRSALMQSNPVHFITGAVDDPKLGVKKKTYDNEEEARLRTYPVNGHLVHPSCAFRRAMGEAVKGRKWGKQAARMIVVGAVFPVEEWCIVLDGKGKPAKKYEIDLRSVVIKTTKARVLRARPKFPSWQMDLPLEVDTDLISLDQVTEALELAGKIIGIGEFRPDPSDGKSGIGTFGRFTAKLVS